MTKVQGWFKFYPKTLENPLIMKDAEHLAIWTYLLMKASHKEFDIIFAGERKTIYPGQIVTGRKQIAKDLCVNENKIYRVLNSYEIEQQIEQVTDHKKTVITILNWNMYQVSEQVIEQEMNKCRTSSEQVVNTKIRIIDYKNNKNIKENEIDKSISSKKHENIIPPTFEMVDAYCKERDNGIDAQKFIDFYESKGWLIGKTKMKNWKAAVRTWEQKDKPQKRNGWLYED